jgi:hypothetical protein
MADNDGRRICIYGTWGETWRSSNGDATEEVEHFAVANYKKGDWTGYIECPRIDRGAFLAATGWDATTSKWGEQAPDPNHWYQSLYKISCEEFLSKELKGTWPKEFTNQRLGNFCDNIQQDVLYDFSVTTSNPGNGQANVVVSATNTNVALKL